MLRTEESFWARVSDLERIVCILPLKTADTSARKIHKLETRTAAAKTFCMRLSEVLVKKNV